MSYTYYTNSEKLSAKIEFNEKLTLPANSPNICCIKNVSINTDVIDSKVVSIPLNNIIDEKKLNLSKEKLLISGWVCINISYTSSKNNKYLNNACFKVGFNIHIPLNKSVGCCKDLFSVTSDIKNICTNPCGCKNIFQKFSLFLFAKKTGSISPNPPTPPKPEPPVPPKPDPSPALVPKKLPNKIIINNNAIIKEEVATIEFNADDKLLIVNSTGLIPDNTLGSIIYFSLKLESTDNYHIKENSTILANENANNFKSALNNKSFEYGDILELDYLISKNIAITNYPTTSQNHIPFANKEYYRLTHQGFLRTK